MPPTNPTEPGASLRFLLPTKTEFKKVARLALPVASVQVGMMLMGVVDTIMVGHFTATDLAAVALGNLYFFTVVVVPMGLLMSLDPVVSQAVGAGDRASVGRALQRGGLLALGLVPAACDWFHLSGVPTARYHEHGHVGQGLPAHHYDDLSGDTARRAGCLRSGS